VTGPRRRACRVARVGDDTGASLVLALALTTFLGLVIGALLTYSGASVRAARTADARATATYDADGALKTAINQIRNSTFNNDPGSTCPDTTVPGTGTSTLKVTCTAGPGSAASSERVPITAANRPGQTVLALGTNSGETGIAQTGGNALRVQGKVFSNGPITTGTGSLESVDAEIRARGTCSGSVISRDAQGNQVSTVCSTTSGLPSDPAYIQPTAGLTWRPLPTCDTSSTVEFTPGYYDDAVGLSDMMDGDGPCAGKTFLFPAAAGGVGIYYFDFHNGEGGGLPAGSRVWTIADRNARVVGGTPQGWTPDLTTPPASGSCVSPLNATTSNGVEFVFGGDSRMALRSGAVDLCGQYSTTTPPVAVYGARTGNDTTTSKTAVTDKTGTNPGTGPTFADPSRIYSPDSSAASAVIDSTTTLAGVTASVAVKGFLPASTVPPGSVLSSAKLVIVHRDNNDTGSRLTSLKVTVTPTRTVAAPLANVPQPTIYSDGPSGTTYHTDTLDLLPSLGPDVHANGYAGLQIRYDAGASLLNKVTENLDSIRVTLVYRRPALRGQKIAVNGGANCVALHPSGCDLLETEAGSALSVQGTVYAPYASLDLRLSGVTAPVIRAGTVARALQLQVTAAASYTGPLLDLPSTSSGPVPLEVYFRAYLAAKVVATARVRFPATDPTAAPTAGRRSVTVLSWTIRRT
jgi:Tfp pilus assembly protein PilX